MLSPLTCSMHSSSFGPLVICALPSFASSSRPPGYTIETPSVWTLKEALLQSGQQFNFLQLGAVPASSCCQCGVDLRHRLTVTVLFLQSDASSDSIGSVLCRTADQLGAIAIVMARRSRSKLQEFFLGSITSFCTHHSQQPVLCVH